MQDTSKVDQSLVIDEIQVLSKVEMQAITGGYDYDFSMSAYGNTVMAALDAYRAIAAAELEEQAPEEEPRPGCTHDL